MPKTPLKSAERIAAPQSEADAPRTRSSPDARSLRQVAAAASAQPPAVAKEKRVTIVMTLKVGIKTADALAERAERDGLTQKQLICQALAAFNVPVDALDLQDRTRRRLRGIAA